MTTTSRRCFLKCAAAGALLSTPCLSLAERMLMCCPPTSLGPKTKVRVGKLYLGNPHPGWPMSTVDLGAEVRQFEKSLAGMSKGLADVEFVDAGLVRTEPELAGAMAKFGDVDGILVLHLTMGIGGQIQRLFSLNKPIVLFSPPYSGHEWHTIAGWQREGKPIEVFPSSNPEDVLVALRPFRAIHRLREARILHINQSPADPAYCRAIKERFGTEVVSLSLADLQKAYESASLQEAEADARLWIKGAKKIVEPTREEILKASRMYLAMRDLMLQHQGTAVTMNCLGMGLMDKGMAYPCLGFVRFNNLGLAGVCEADLKSTMTQLMFTFLVGKPGFVTDPVFDFATNTIIHAHCVAATQMEGPGTSESSYHIRSHLEDGRGVSLQVRLPVNRRLSMARLIGTDTMLFSTGDAVDSPFVERGCRSKVSMRVENIDRFLENWSSGLHRVIFYGDHSRDISRYCRFAQIRLLREGIDDFKKENGLDWDPHVHA